MSSPKKGLPTGVTDSIVCEAGSISLRSDIAPEAAAAVLVGGIIGAEVQHYQDPAEIDLRRVLDTLVEQLIAWLAVPGAIAGVAATGGETGW